MEPKAGARPDFIRMMPEMAKLLRARLVCLFKSLSFRALFLLLLSYFSRVRLCATLKTAGSPPGSSVPGILQARILEWVAISFPILELYCLLYLTL